jgi:hypothetical protein
MNIKCIKIRPAGLEHTKRTLRTVENFANS